MKKTLLVALTGLMPFLLNAQCSATVTSTSPTCYNACNGTASVATTGAAPFQYLWGPNGQTTQSVTGLCAGAYSVNIIDNNGCTRTEYFTITQPTQVVAGYSTQPASCSNCQDGSATANPTGGTPPYTYNWFPSGNGNVTETGLNPGTYSFTVTDATGCTVGTLFNIGNSNSVGVNEHDGAGDLSVFPNPASQSVIISQTFSNPVSAEIRLTNLRGEIVYTETKQQAINLYTSLDISLLPAGVYFIAVTTKGGTSVQKITKE